MPELPEVESLRQLLAHHLNHARIVDACFPSPGILRGTTETEFRAATQGRIIVSIDRRGKYLLFTLAHDEDSRGELESTNGELRLVVHLRMRGGLRVESENRVQDKYLCAFVRLEDGRELRFYDMWRWGEWWLVPPSPQPTGIAGLDAMGIEPFDPNFTVEFLSRSLEHLRTPIKPLLLGQRIVAGLGNIYCDESLHRAGLHPSRPAKGLSRQEVQRLHAAIGAVLCGAIAEGRAIVEQRIAEEANLETFEGLSSHSVYDRPGSPCPTCGENLQKILLHGRGTTFCPQCQPVAVFV